MTATERIKLALLGVKGMESRVWHYYALDHTPPYIVWAEDGQGQSVSGDGQMVNQAISGTVDLFMADLDDMELPDAVQTALNGCQCAWRLNSVQFEEDTGLKHYEWVWEVVSDGAFCGEGR